MTRLFTLETPAPATRWTGTRLPAIYRGTPACRRCSTTATIDLDAYTTVPLFAAYGHGGATRHQTRLCLACGHVANVGTTTGHPGRLAKVG